VLLCDVMLPGLHATAWLPEVQAIDADLPMILMTGHGDIAMAVQAIREGAYDFIEKPAVPSASWPWCSARPKSAAWC
jgi:two-component system C4-dicarboxylate transport response regulator DctD